VAHTPIRPPFTAYTIEVREGRISNGTMRTVELVQREVDGTFVGLDHLTMDQARELASWLIETANASDAAAAQARAIENGANW